MTLTLVLAFTQAGFAQVTAGGKQVSTAVVRKIELSKTELERIASEGKTPSEKRRLIIDAYKDNSLIQAVSTAMKADKTDVLNHLATNPAALETLEYANRILQSKNASALDQRAARDISMIFRYISRSSATTAKDQADIPATRKAVVVASKVAEYGEPAVKWLDVVSKKISEGVPANQALRIAARDVLGLKAEREIDVFMSKDPKDLEESFVGCKL